MPRSVAPVADEREGLLAYLDQQRLILRLTAHGLTKSVHGQRPPRVRSASAA